MSLDAYQHYRITGKQNQRLAQISPDPWDDLPICKKEARKELSELHERLIDLQQRFFVDRRRKLLIILQGMDTSGKNGTIKHVFRGVNPQGVDVASFDKPTKQELAHDFLWRIHRHAPANGEIVIFDRSHYEDVLAVRVNRLQPERIWKNRYHHIREFERMLVDEGTMILKFFLHIDRATQKQRLQERLDIPAKNWKFDASDLVAREKWGQYEKAYEDVFSETTTDYAPWYVIPANKKWARNLLVARMVVASLDDLHLSYPRVDFDPASVKIQ